MSNEIAKTEETRVIQMPKANQRNLSVFSDSESFSLASRMADALSRSTIVPSTYQGNPSNCMIAIEMASRINTSPMMVMQNLYIVHGTPAWSSQWIIAMINNSKRYKTELKFDIQHDGKGDLKSCYAWAEDYNGNRVVGPTITMQMARDEGWVSKSGSKWKTMPEVMIRYRAASFFGRLNCPDMIMGIYSQEEVIDGFGNQPEDILVESAQADVTGDEGTEETDPELARIITQEERQYLLGAISDKFSTAEAKNETYKKVLTSVGISSSTKMTYGQYLKALEIVDSMDGDVVDAEEKVAETAEGTDAAEQ